jgi:group I intron endonuclease
MHYIYLIKNKVNDKGYVGQSKDVLQRWRHHRSVANKVKNSRDRVKNAYIIHYAIVKYGEGNFEFSIIEECDTQEEANDREVYWVKKFETYGGGYNCTPGGSCYSGLDHPLCPLTSSMEQDIIKKYTENGMSAEEITKDYDFGPSVIYRALYRNNIDRRSAGFYKAGTIPVNKMLTEAQEKKICSKYKNEKINIMKLGEIYNCHYATINNLLRRNNIETLGNKVFSKGKHYSLETEFKKGQEAHNKLFTDNQEQEIIKKYMGDKLNTVQLGKIYNCHKSVISRMLHRHGLATRRGKLTDEQKYQILNDYLDLGSSIKTAKKHGVNKSTVLRLVKKLNCDI